MADRFEFSFQVEGLDDDKLRVLSFEGEESISEPYEYDIELTSEDFDVEFEDVVGKTAVLEIHTDNDPRLVHGLVSRFEQIRQGRKLGFYRARLVPRMWVLKLCTRSRIFQDMTTKQIIDQVLKDMGVAEAKWALNRSYKARLYCVQYRESDFAFVSRLMEEEGMFYYFDVPSDASVERMIIADHPQVHEPLACGADPELPFRGEEGGLSGHVAITQFAVRRSMRTGVVMLREFDFKKPHLDLTAKKEGDSDTESAYEFYDYPGEYPDPNMGKAYAEIRLQQLRARREVIDGVSNSRPMAPGFKFELSEHPRDAFNGEYLLTQVSHEGNQPSAAEEEGMDKEMLEAPVYTNSFEAIQAAIPFRPRRRTPRPTVEGVQTAIVTGPSGEEIHVDEHGRVKVQFHWDREGRNDDKSSCWVRVAQAQTSGSMLLPRIGWEVIVDFIEGDPDRPIIIGRLHNAGEPHPYGLPASKTQTSFKSSTSPGGSTGNELRFEDSKGKMEFFMNASRDMNVVVGNDETWLVEANDTTHVKGDQMLKVDGNQSDVIGTDRSIEVKGDHAEAITGEMSLKVDGDQTIAVVGGRKDDVNGEAKTKIDGNVTDQYSADHKLDVGGKQDVKIGAAWTQQARTLKQTIQATSKETVGASKKTTVGALYTITAAGKYGVTASSLALKSAGKVVIQASKIEIKGTAQIELQAGGSTVSLGPAGIDIKTAAIVTINGALVKIN